MGMFDYVIDDEGVEYQTKSMGCSMNRYKLKDGVLWLKKKFVATSSDSTGRDWLAVPCYSETVFTSYIRADIYGGISLRDDPNDQLWLFSFGELVSRREITEHYAPVTYGCTVFLSRADLDSHHQNVEHWKEHHQEAWEEHIKDARFQAYDSTTGEPVQLSCSPSSDRIIEWVPGESSFSYSQLVNLKKTLDTFHITWEIDERYQGMPMTEDEDKEGQ